jgi:hypothetical protein
MRHSPAALLAAALLAGSLLALDPPPKPAADKDRIEKLVQQLGSPSFQLREAAVRDLVALGPDVLPAVAAATRSADPEVARRARDVFNRVSRQAANDRALAPTTVDLAAEDTLQAVLDDLTRQSGYTVKLAGAAAVERAGRKFGVKTGPVPFWAAVRAVCDAADLRVAAAGGFVAPGSVYDAPAKAGVAPPLTGVHLEARGGDKPRPAAVHRGVLVEAFAVPAVAAGPDAAVTVLQVWPEPKLGWRETTGVRGVRATTPDGRTLAGELGGPNNRPMVAKGNGVRFVTDATGKLVIVNDKARVPLPGGGPFTPNTRQALVRLVPGDHPAAAAKELTGTVLGTVLAGPEPLAAVRLPADDKPAEAAGTGGLELRAGRAGREGDEPWVGVELRYDPARVDTAGPAEPLPGAGPVPPAGNHTVYGVRVTDAAGRPFTAVLKSFRDSLGGDGRPTTYTFDLALTPTVRGQGGPHTVTVWGRYNKSVEVPFTLADVPLAGGPP